MSGKLAVAMSNNKRTNETGTKYIAQGKTTSNPQSNATDNFLKIKKWSGLAGLWAGPAAGSYRCIDV